jgi:hypothetical protein|nr:MAG TPA: Lactococcus phage M3 protein [Caudoviricetes sp.]
MFFVGIDPSYTRTGVGLLLRRLNFPTESVSKKEFLSTVFSESRSVGNFDISNCLKNSEYISNHVYDIILNYHKLASGQIIPVVEYPVIATFAGPYLMLIQPKLHTYFQKLYNLGVIPYYYLVPSAAIPSLLKTKKIVKSELVKKTKELLKIEKKLNHDEASALLIAYMGYLIDKGKYKNKYYKIEF